MIKTNYHTHTIRCGHASGEDEEFILAAIALGFTELGFTDHIMLPDRQQIGIRGDYSLLDDYIDSLNALKEPFHYLVYMDKMQMLLQYLFQINTFH